MEITTQQVKIKKTLNIDAIEKELLQFGELLRWAVVEVQDENYIVDGVFMKG